ncbi:MAG: hypothetical protein K4571_13630 [Deltaproteobacteria bacterium]
MNKIIKSCGIAFILMWVLQATYLFQYFPFTNETKENTQQLTREASQLPAGLHAGTVLENKTPEALQKEMDAALKLNWVKSLVLVVCGIIVGCLLFLQKTIGYFFAFVFSAALIVHKSFIYFASGNFSIQSYVSFFQYFPMDVLREIIMVLVLVFTFIVLTSAYVGKMLKRNEAK